MSTIELKKLGKRFGAFQAVKDVDLAVAKGEVVCCSALRAAARPRPCG